MSLARNLLDQINSASESFSKDDKGTSGANTLYGTCNGKECYIAHKDGKYEVNLDPTSDKDFEQFDTGAEAFKHAKGKGAKFDAKSFKEFTDHLKSVGVTEELVLDEASASVEDVLKALRSIDFESDNALTYSDMVKIAEEILNNHIDDVDATLAPEAAKKAVSVIKALKAFIAACKD